MRSESMYGDGLFSIVKGVGVSLGVSFLLAVVFASILRASSIPDNVIYPVNQTIKSVSILLGVLASVRGNRGLLKGGVIGILFTAFSYLLFSAVGGDFSVSWLIFAEMFLCVFVGGLSGAIAVNVKR